MDHRDIPVLTHSSPARRSSDLASVPGGAGRAAGPASLARCQVRPEGPMLRLENLQKRYRTGDLALKGVDLSVPDGQIMALIGPSGARSEEHTSELQSLLRISSAVFCLKKTNNLSNTHTR